MLLHLALASRVHLVCSHMPKKWYPFKQGFCLALDPMSSSVPFLRVTFTLSIISHDHWSSTMKASTSLANCNFQRTTKGHMTSSQAQREYAATSYLQSLVTHDIKSSSRRYPQFSQEFSNSIPDCTRPDYRKLH